MTTKPDDDYDPHKLVHRDYDRIINLIGWAVGIATFLGAMAFALGVAVATSVRQMLEGKRLDTPTVLRKSNHPPAEIQL